MIAHFQEKFFLISVNQLEKEWKYIENNFKECKINRRQSNLKEPPMCEFYKALNFMDPLITIGNDDVMKYPDVPDIRIIFNTCLKTGEWIFKCWEILKRNDFKCSCSDGNDRENEKHKVNKNIESDSESSTEETGIYRYYFNYKLFIKHVKGHECIWNRYHEEYNNKESRKRAWLDIFRGMGEDEENRAVTTRVFWWHYHKHGE